MPEPAPVTRQTLPSKRIDQSSLSVLAGLDRLDDVEAFEFRDGRDTGCDCRRRRCARGGTPRTASRPRSRRGCARSCATSRARDRRRSGPRNRWNAMKPGTPDRWLSRLVQTFSKSASEPGVTRKRFIAMNMLAPPRTPYPGRRWRERTSMADATYGGSTQMPVSFRQLHPAFAAEVSGIDCRTAAQRAMRSRRSRRAWTAMPCWCFPDQDITDEQQLAFTRHFGELENYATGGHIRKRADSRLGRGHGRLLQPRQGRQDHVGRGPRLVLQAGRPAVALGQFVPPGAGEILAAVRTGVAVMGRQHRIRRHARRLRRARRAHQGRGGRPGLPAFADLLASGDRLHRSDRAGDRRRSRRCASAWCARIR